MNTAQKIITQSEINLEQLYRIIRELPFEQRLTLAEEIKREALREQWQTLSKTLPDIPDITENDILSEINLFRKENKVHTL